MFNMPQTLASGSRHLLSALPLGAVFALCVSAASAQETGSPPALQSEPPSLMQRGLELFFEGIEEELTPGLQQLQDMAEEFGPALQNFLLQMGPALADLAGEVQDWSRYELPEILPNGDIIIRRKPDAPHAEDAPAEVPDAEGAIDI